MQAIIIAGGFGTRLKQVISGIPKVMAPINGRPFLEFILSDLKRQGFSSVVLAVGYRHEVIFENFGYWYKSMRLSYSIEKEPLGTGGAVKKSYAKNV